MIDERNYLVQQADRVVKSGVGSKLESTFLKYLLLRDAVFAVKNNIQDDGPILLCGIGDGRVYHHLTGIFQGMRILVCDWKFINLKLDPPQKDRINPRDCTNWKLSIAPSLCIVQKINRIPFALGELIEDKGIVVIEEELGMGWSLLSRYSLGKICWYIFIRESGNVKA